MIGELTAVTILAELGDARRFSSSRDAVRFAGLDITVHQSDQRRAPDISPARARPRCAGRCLRPPMCAAGGRLQPDHEYYSQAAERLGANRACLAVARKMLKRSYHRCANSARRRSHPHDLARCAPSPSSHQMRRGRLPPAPAATTRVDGPYRPSGRNASPSGITPSTIMSPTQTKPGSWTEIRLGARAHTHRPTNRAHPPPRNGSPTINPDPGLRRAPAQIRSNGYGSSWSGPKGR